MKDTKPKATDKEVKKPRKRRKAKKSLADKFLKTSGLYSLTELRFVSCDSCKALKGVGESTIKELRTYLRESHLRFGKLTLADYKTRRDEVWADAAGRIVFKYHIRPLVGGMGHSTEWAVGEFSPRPTNFEKSGKPIINFRAVSEDTAEDIIESDGLVLALKNKEGEIYDSPKGKFLKQFGNNSAVLTRAESLDPYTCQRFDWPI